MKKILLLFALFITCTIHAQYKTFVFGNLEYKTECHYNKNNFVTIKISMQSLDSYPIEMIIGTSKEYDSFMKRLDLIKAKMIEWDSVCVQNNIDKIDKLIEYEVGKKDYPLIWFGSYYNSSPLICAYGRDGGRSKVVLHTGEVTALMNKYIKCKGGIIVFNSAQDVEEMIQAFNLIDIQKYIDTKNEKANLLQ